MITSLAVGLLHPRIGPLTASGIPRASVKPHNRDIRSFHGHQRALILYRADASSVRKGLSDRE